MSIIPVANPDLLEISYLQKIKVKTQIIYTILLLAVITAICALPFITVDVSIKSRGLIQAPLEKSELLVPVNGHISMLNLKENQKVHKGDTLLRIDALALSEQNGIVAKRITELQELLEDIRLIGGLEPNMPGPIPNTDRYKAAWKQYRNQLYNASIAKNQANKQFDRFRQLHERKVISESEYEDYEVKKEQASAQYDLIVTQNKSQWESEASSYRSELNQLSRDQSTRNNQKSFYTLCAPLDGNIQNLSGIHTGTPVFANQKIAEISPEAGLIAMLLVTPSDIGLIKKGQNVRFQVDAFNYNQWGIINGTVLEIAEDMVLEANNRPVFKVKCDLGQKEMKLFNGYVGKLKKGMTLQGSFMVAKRSLFQLLYDKVDDWINPNTLSNSGSVGNNRI